MRMDISIFNEVHMAGLTEKVIFEQRDEGNGKEPSRQVWRKYSWQRNLRWESLWVSEEE